jgi:plastocyanin
VPPVEQQPPINPIVGSGLPPEHHKLPKKKWIVVCVLGLFVAAIAIVIVRQAMQSGDLQPTVEISSTVARVDLTPTGYLPSSIKVKKGQQITFTNQDTKPHRLFADQDMLPGFDTVEFLNQGDAYTYIFVTSGTFKYYDPDAPKQFVGNISVE